MAEIAVGPVTTTAGVKVRLADARLPVQAYLIRPLPGNTGKCYIGNTDTFVVATLSGGVLYVVEPPNADGFCQPASASSPAANPFNLNDLRLDVEVDDEGVLVTAVQQ